MAPLSGGGNNRAFRVETGGGKLFMKIYFHHPKDKRDRLKSEYGFCEFLWSQGLRSVPRPLLKDRKKHIGFYEYIDGRLLSEKDVTPKRVREAVRFFLDFNKRRGVAAAKRLPPASEARFSIEDQLALVRGRLARLEKIKNETPQHAQAIRFVALEMKPMWRAIEARVRVGAARAGLPLQATLPQNERCLSPSDFGFHNAILTPRGRLRFIDFEYAGWDDLAKTVCDFSLQPRLPFPQKLLPLFAKPVLRAFGNEARQRARARLLYPVFAFKWCCIILNEFLKSAGGPRRFSQGGKNRRPRLIGQLKKAENYLARARGPVPEL